MKLITFLLTVICFQLSATSVSQTVTLSVKNAPLEKVLTEVKKQTGYSVIWDERQLEGTSPVTLQVKNASLEETLRRLLASQSLSYQVIGKMIVIKKTTPVIRENDASELYIPPFSVYGIVQDNKGEPLQGASVLIKGTRIGAMTAASGRFMLQTNTNDSVVTLQVTSLGYAPREMKVKNGQGVTVVLNKTEAKLDEVIVSTGIFERKKENYTGAATTVTAEELAMFGNRNLLVSLRNIDPSFNIIQNNIFGGDPNRLPEVQIRGNSSLPNVNELQDENRAGMNTPLIILDGFESTLQRLLDINQNEVESLTMLKDASATAIYGSRGANGVIVIKTRTPQSGKGGKLRLSYRGDLSLETPDLTSYNVLKSQEKLDLEYLAGLYTGNRVDSDQRLKEYYYYLQNEINRGVETDWLSKPLRTGVGQRHNLRVEGGDRAFRYSLSVQLNDLQGAMKDSYRKVFNGTIMISYLYRNFRFTNNTIIALGNSVNSPYGTFSDYVKLNPYWAPYDEKGNVYRQLGDPGSNIYGNRWSSLPGNPLYNATLNSYDKSQSTDIINNLSIEWKLRPDLTFRGRFGVTATNGERHNFLSANHTSFFATDLLRRGTYDYEINKFVKYDAGFNLNYSRQFGKHSVFAGLDYNIRQDNSTSYGFKAEGFNNPSFDFIAMALQYPQNSKPSGTESLKRSVGVTGSVNYTYDDRYLLDLSARADGSSQFGTLNRFAPFWSVGVGWNLHKEKAFRDLPYINRLKLRGSTGITGSQNFQAYQALRTYRYSTTDRYLSWIGAGLMGLGNEDLKWQQKKNYNIGLDAELFSRRLILTADLYEETTDGLVSSVDLPASSGFTSYIDNIGKMRNKGIELRATVVLIKNQPKSFTWNISTALMHNQNRIVKISQALKNAQKNIEEQVTSVPANLYREGYAYNTIWVVPSLGIDPNTGKEVYMGKDGKPTLTWSPVNLAASGLSEAKYQGNMSTLVRYKTLTLNLSFNYRFGGQTYNQTLIDKVETSNFSYNVDARVYNDRWKNTGDYAAFKSLLVTTPTYKSSRFVQDDNTWQLQNASIQYEIRAPFVKRVGFQTLSVSGNMSDIFYISSVQRERGTGYPFTRNFSLTLNAMF